MYRINYFLMKCLTETWFHNESVSLLLKNIRFDFFTDNFLDGGYLLIGITFLTFIVYFFWKTLADVIQNRLKYWLEGKDNLIFALFYIVPTIVFLVIGYFIAFLLSSSVLVVTGYFYFFSKYKQKVIKNVFIISQLVLCCIFFYGNQLYQKNKREEIDKNLIVYFLLPPADTIGISDKNEVYKMFRSVFLSVFENIEHIKILPKNLYDEFFKEFSLDKQNEKKIANEIIKYGIKKGEPVDIVVKNKYVLYKMDTDVYSILLTLKVPTDSGLFGIDESKINPPYGDKNDIEYMAIYASYHITKKIKNHKDIVLKVHDENRIWCNILERYRTFLIPVVPFKNEECEGLLSDVEGKLKKPCQVTEGEIDILLRRYKGNFNIDDINKRIEESRNANISKLRTGG